MWELLEVSIPAVVLIPLVAIGVVLWVCFQQNARSSDVRRAEFLRLQRVAMEEHERAERELEREYLRHKGGDPVEPQPQQQYRGRVVPEQPDVRNRRGNGNGYGNSMDVGLGEWRDPAEDARRRRQAEEEEGRRKQAELEAQRRKHLEAEEFRRKQDEVADRKRRVNLEDEMMRRRQAEEQDWQRRRADLEAQARREAEEERRRQAAEHVENPPTQTRWKHEEALKPPESPLSVRNHHQAHPSMSGGNLNCVVCHKPTKVKRRCSRCKSMNYCSRECQVKHWNDGHKMECRPHDTSASPRGSVDGDTRTFSDFSPRS